MLSFPKEKNITELHIRKINCFHEILKTMDSFRNGTSKNYSCYFADVPFDFD